MMRASKPHPTEVRFTPHKNYTIEAVGSIGLGVELDAPFDVTEGVEYVAKIFGQPGGERASVARADENGG